MANLEGIKKSVLDYVDKEKSYANEKFSFFLNKEIDAKFDFNQVFYGGNMRSLRNIRARFSYRYLWYRETEGFAPIGFFIDKVGGCFSPKFEYSRLYLGNMCLEGIREGINYLEISNGRKLLGSYRGSGISGQYQCHDSVFSGSIKIPHILLHQEFPPDEAIGIVTIGNVEENFLISGNYSPDKNKKSKFEFNPSDKYPNIFLQIPALNYTLDQKLLLLYLFCRSYTFYI